MNRSSKQSLYYSLYIPCSYKFRVFTKLHILILTNASLYPPNFANISSITVKIVAINMKEILLTEKEMVFRGNSVHQMQKMLKFCREVEG